MKSYKTLSQWREDLELFRENPTDQDLMKAIQNRFKNSDPALKDQIKDLLISAVMSQQNPYAAFAALLKSQSGTTLIVKSKEDPWFEC